MQRGISAALVEAQLALVITERRWGKLIPAQTGQDIFGMRERRADRLLMAHRSLGAPFKRRCQGGANARASAHDLLSVTGNLCSFGEVRVVVVAVRLLGQYPRVRNWIACFAGRKPGCSRPPAE